MNRLWFIILLVIPIVICDNREDNGTYTNEFKEFCDEHEGSRVLSRRKRFVIFPDGSSFQLVFVLQTAALIPIGDIFLFATTAGLAWSLPTDPKIFSTFKEFEKPLRRSDVVKTINYLDEKGRLIAKVPYKRRLMVNPAFGKRSIEDNLISDGDKPKIDRKQMHEKHLRTDHFNHQRTDKDSMEFHRSKRVELYQKIEKLLSAMGRDGRRCVLYKLCESAQRGPTQGTFLQEFLRAVFTLPKGEEFQFDDLKEYDKAHTETDDCSARYPGCDLLQESI
ncbi:hypothetical protein PYW07_002927 [Mythimna separata]|uniref:Uncharacterized protein n=1 Tax=Mythimna separata TaxID=271217 RepID=A0AAD7YGT3_MYTSE|nr:hypothetical protein PYW07_002927 [Mythimna separata]